MFKSQNGLHFVIIHFHGETMTCGWDINMYEEDKEDESIEHAG